MARRMPWLLAALVVLAAVPSAAAATTQSNLITNSSPGHTASFGQFDSQSYAVADFDGDGVRELVTFNDNRALYVLSSTSGRVLAELWTTYPSGWGVRSINDPEATDVDGDGRPEIVAVNSAGYVCVLGYTSGTSTTSMSFSQRWCKRMSEYGGMGADAGPAVGDVDGDGRKEIFSNTEERGLFAFNHDGSVRWKSSDYGGNAGPLLTDLDGDGRKEVVFFGDGGEVRARDAATGSHKWTFYASQHVWPASIPVSGNAADLDGDGKKEVVFMARDAHDATNLRNNHLMLFVLSSSGSLKWKVQPSWANPMSYTHPILADLNGDGKKDILAMDWNTMGHKPGNWETLNPAHVFAYSHSGTLLWKTDVQDTWSNDDLVLADATGDGVQDVLAIGYGSSCDGIWYLDSRTGAKQQHVPMCGWTALRGAVAADYDGSGKLGWAISLHSSTKGGAFAFFKTDAPCNGAFLGWHASNGCGGGGATPPPPPPPPPPPTGTFDATFSSVKGNEWWIQASVSATGDTLASVDVSLNGGAWKPLANKGWGWAASYHAPEGTIVQLRATSASGATDLSGCYRWVSAAPVECSGGTAPPPPPTGGTFSATFKNVRGNEWWIETDVSASGGTLAGVDVRVNGGAWVALTKQSWGSWAKSLHAPAGSKVEFRARASDGQTATSAAYTWPPT